MKKLLLWVGAEAMNNLGWMYEKGEGVKVDFQIAMDWYEKAANLGSIDAMNNIALMYEKGKGRKRDAQKAAEWYEKADKAKNI
jgi:uncharacterized protein